MRCSFFIFPFLFFLLTGAAATKAEGAKAKGSLAFQHHTRGVELAGRSKWNEALEKFQAAIDLSPNFISSYIEWSRAAAMLGRRKDALEKLSMAMAVAKTKEEKNRIFKEKENLSDIFYTNETFQLYQNGLNYLKLDRPGSASEVFEKALKVEPDNLSILGSYAKALQLDEKHKEALAILERAFGLNDNKNEIRLDLAEAILVSNPSRSLQLLKPLLLDALDERVCWVNAQALLALKKNRDAIEFLRSNLEKQPSWVYTHFWLGKLYALEQDGSWNARKHLMTFLKRSPLNEDPSKVDADPELRKLKASREEAEAILNKVNQSLE